MQVGVQSAADIDLGALRHALWRKKFLILGLTLLAAAIAFAGVNLVTPRYKSEARVLIEMRENIFFRPDAEKTTDRGTTVDQEAVTSQVQLILSRDLAREVIKKLKLAERPEFDPVLGGPSLLRSVLSLTGIIKDPLDMTPEERVYKSYYERLTAFQVEKSRVVAIEFESQDPELAAQVANAIADAYLRFQQAAKQVRGSPARSRGCARTSLKRKQRSSNIGPRPISSLVTTTPRCRTSNSEISTASSLPRAPRRQTPRPRRSSFETP